MRFGLIHRIMTDALAVLGLLSLVTSGEVQRWVSIAMLAGVAMAITIPERWQDRAFLRQFGVIAPVSLLLVQAARLFLGTPVLQLAVEFAAALQVVRLATRRGAAHDQQVIVLALLHLIAGTVLGSGLAYGLCFLGFLVVAPGALVLSHLRREVEGNYRQGARDRTGLPVDVPRILRSRRVIGKQFLLFTCLLSVPIFVFTALLFVMFPRVGLSLLLLNHSRAERMVGFSDRVDLGDVGTLRTDPTIAMRVEYPNLPKQPPPRLALYLRGTAFDHYDGRRWLRTRTQRVPAPRHQRSVVIVRPPKENDRIMHIELEAFEPPVVFLPQGAVALEARRRGEPVLGHGGPLILAGPEGEYKYSASEDRGLSYQVYLPRKRVVKNAKLSDAQRQRYLSLPPNLTPQVQALAQKWVGKSADPAQRAKRIETRLRKDYKYDLSSKSGAENNPLEHFLFESKAGHCEYYSTAMAVMLRTLGVPTRNVTGFIGGSYNRFGNYYAVRQGDAHSWVEVHLDGVGWTRFDPTPPGNAAPQSEITGFFAYVRDFVEASAQRWNRHVVRYDLNQQTDLLKRLTDGYRDVRDSTPLLRGPLGSWRRAAIFGGGLALLGIGIVALRRARQQAKRGGGKRGQNDEDSSQAVALYQQLEGALLARGLARQASTPPLKHAQSLVKTGHPLSEEVLELTERYLEARFGKQPLDDSERKQFVQRVRAIKQWRPPEQSPAP